MPADTTAHQSPPPPSSNAMYVAIAEKLRTHPESLAIALENVERWLMKGHSVPHCLEQWRSLILAAAESAEGMDALQQVLSDPSEKAAHFRGFSPFAGILTREERRPFLCSYKH